ESGDFRRFRARVRSLFSGRDERPKHGCASLLVALIGRWTIIMPFIEVHDGTRLHYADWGSGKPLLLIHGWAIGAAMWEYQMPSLIRERHTLYRVRSAGLWTV